MRLSWQEEWGKWREEGMFGRDLQHRCLETDLTAGPLALVSPIKKLQAPKAESTLRKLGLLWFVHPIGMS